MRAFVFLLILANLLFYLVSGFSGGLWKILMHFVFSSSCWPIEIKVVRDALPLDESNTDKLVKVEKSVKPEEKDYLRFPPGGRFAFGRNCPDRRLGV